MKANRIRKPIAKLARSAGDGDFYQHSQVDARLRELELIDRRRQRAAQHIDLGLRLVLQQSLAERGVGLGLQHVQLRVRAVQAQRLLEHGERLVERMADMRNRLRLFGRQVVQVLVHRVARMDLVLHAIEAGHQQSAHRQVVIAGAIAGPEFDPLGFFAGRILGNPDRGTAIGQPEKQLHRRLEAGQQPFIRVGARVGKGRQ